MPYYYFNQCEGTMLKKIIVPVTTDYPKKMFFKSNSLNSKNINRSFSSLKFRETTKNNFSKIEKSSYKYLKNNLLLKNIIIKRNYFDEKSYFDITEKEKIIKNQILGLYNINQLTMNYRDSEHNFYVLDCSKIAAFLANTTAVHAQLVKMNQKISEVFKEHNLTGIYDEQKRYQKGSIKLFRQFLESELARFGFQPYFSQILGGLNEKEFGALLQKGMAFKDTFFRASKHGEFTHALQWLIIAWAIEDNHLNIKNDVINLYKKSGTVLGSNNAFGEKTVWDLIVDMSPFHASFRSPEYFCEYLMNVEKENAKELNILTDIFLFRFEKGIKGEFVKNNSDDPKAYDHNLQKLKFYKNKTNDSDGKYKVSDISPNLLEPKIKNK